MRLARPGEDGALWQCATCGRPYAGICIPEVLRESKAELVLAESYFESTDEAEVHFETWKAAFELALRTNPSPYQSLRREFRKVQVAKVEAVEMTSDLQPVGSTIFLVMTNISPSGIGLVHEGQLEQQFLAIRFPPIGNTRIQAIAEIVRQDPWGDGLYDIGGTLIHRLGSQVSSD